MQSIRKPLRARTAIVACACAGLLAGGAGAAAAAPSTAPHAPASATTGSPSPSPKASITAHATPTKVQSGKAATLSGKTTGLKSGDKLTLERMTSNGKWQKLKEITTTVKKDGSYTMKLQFAQKGTNKLRVSHGRTASPPVTVTVS